MLHSKTKIKRIKGEKRCIFIHFRNALSLLSLFKNVHFESFNTQLGPTFAIFLSRKTLLLVVHMYIYKISTRKLRL